MASTSTETYTTETTTSSTNNQLEPTAIQQLPNSPHLKELKHISSLSSNPSTSFLQQSKLSVPYALLLYILHAIRTFFLSLIFSPLTIFQDPLSTLVAVVIYPIVLGGLWCMMSALYLASLVGGGKVVRWLGDNYGMKYSPVNWANPGMFGKDSLQVIAAAKIFLTGERTTYPDVLVPGTTDDETHTLRIFSVDLSIALLLFSSIVYERDDEKVLEATKYLKLASKKPIGSIENLEFLKIASNLLIESEARIREQATKWGCRYEIVSDLASLAGPFASVFYSQEGEEPFIVLVFKGTGLSNFAEFLVDASFVRFPSKVFLGAGAAHQGFYTDLFPTSEGGADGYGTILQNLHQIASTLQSSTSSKPVPLWIAGHSLGSALASLTHFRLLYSPSDLDAPSGVGAGLVLRDSYNYGTPRLGNGEFASQFSSLAIQPVTRESILWRVIDETDFVTHIPPGISDDESTRDSIMKSSTLDYSHIGIPIQLTDSNKILNGGVEGWKGEEELNGFYTKTKVGFSRIVAEVEEYGGIETPLSKILKYLPIPKTFANHFPAFYFARLNRIRATMKESSEGVWINIVQPAPLQAGEKDKGV